MLFLAPATFVAAINCGAATPSTAKPLAKQSVTELVGATTNRMSEEHLPPWERASQPLRRQAARFPFERALVMAVAAVVGLYGGIAAGLFSTPIRSGAVVLL